MKRLAVRRINIAISGVKGLMKILESWKNQFESQLEKSWKFVSEKGYEPWMYSIIHAHVNTNCTVALFLFLKKNQISLILIFP